MLILPIKKQWFDMILSGEKTEEYRDIKPYYERRFMKATMLDAYENDEEFDFNEQIRKCPSSMTVALRNGYRSDSPVIVCGCKLTIGKGNPKWGAEPGKEYYVLKIQWVHESQ
jgi:hypothetical protein